MPCFRWRTMISMQPPSLVRIIFRNYSSKTRPKALLDARVESDIQNEVLRPKKHPGVLKVSTVSLPENYLKAIQKVAEDFPIKALEADCQALLRHLHGRVAPMERAELEETHRKIREKVLRKAPPIEEDTFERFPKLEQSLNDKIVNNLKQKVYNWKPVVYDEYNSLLYLTGRAVPDYAVLTKVFKEVSQRDVGFKPRSMFDFGSGIGSATWAAELYWNKSVYEYFNVDSSSFMNELSRDVLNNAWGVNRATSKGVYYRQFLPSTPSLYDLVVASYSLLELPNLKTRMDTIAKLWEKTNNYLIVIERGTNGGFRVINEVRDFVLQGGKGHVFSPCPHDTQCPRLATDNTPCNFLVKYFPLPLGSVGVAKQELFSYVIFKKGERDFGDPQWPRIVRDVLVRTRHSVCRMCTKKGSLEEVVFSAAKQGKFAYRCARSSTWGDLLPVNIQDEEK